MHPILGNITETITVGGILGGLVALATVLLRELSKASGGAWRVVREKNRQIHRLQWEISLWQSKALGTPEPPPYASPPDQELDSL